jgi:hypothetical protein
LNKVNTLDLESIETIGPINVETVWISKTNIAQIMVNLKTCDKVIHQKRNL